MINTRQALSEGQHAVLLPAALGMNSSLELRNRTLRIAEPGFKPECLGPQSPGLWSLRYPHTILRCLEQRRITQRVMIGPGFGKAALFAA